MLLVVATGCSSGDSDEDADERDQASGAAAEVASWEFVSRPDLTPPHVDVMWTDAGDPELIDGSSVLLAVKDQEKGAPMNGPLIVDGAGEPVWVHPQGDTRWAYDLRVQEYRGEPVLTWWRGDTFEYGYGEGEFVLMDQAYREIATVTTPGTPADFHDMTLTARGTALLISYPVSRQDLTDVGGPADGFVRGSVVHEVDVATGRVLFEWDALDHLSLADSEVTIEEDSDEAGTRDAPFDPVHVNSVTEDGAGALLVSARNTHAVYRVLRPSGRVDWTLGGADSDFAMQDDATFAWQHDAERQPDGTITLFDNQAAPQIGERSRGLRLDVDVAAGSASVVTEYLPPPDDPDRLSESQGNLEQLDDGTVLIGWGSMPFYSLYDADGRLLSDSELAGGISYRAHLADWEGRPAEPPRLVIQDGAGHVSWNGATEVAAWRFLAGRDAARARTVATVETTGFETSTDVPDAAYLAVEALDASGRVLATAEPGSWPLGVPDRSRTSGR